MCNETAERTDIPMQPGIGAQSSLNQCNTKLAEPTLRDHLERKRNRLTQQLVQVEEALRLVYTNPDAEKIHETLKRAGY